MKDYYNQKKHIRPKLIPNPNARSGARHRCFRLTTFNTTVIASWRRNMVTVQTEEGRPLEALKAKWGI